MKTIYSIIEDKKHTKQQPGSFEWWYFDAISEDDRFHLVIIFYEGIPFSTKYIKAVETNKRSEDSLAVNHPGLSVSIYDHGKPIFYSLSEYAPGDCDFSEDEIVLQIGNNRLKGEIKEEKLEFRLFIHEELPCGDKIKGELRFSSEANFSREVKSSINLLNEAHQWYLVQPRAEVRGKISISTKSKVEQNIIFKGTGYHDHNLGSNSLHQMGKWYWGRFHFRNRTFVFYYFPDFFDEKKVGWIFNDHNEVLTSFDSVQVESLLRNPFLLASNRYLLFTSETDKQSKADIYLDRSIDSGPFYQRFIAKGVIRVSESEEFTSFGMAEFIKPERIKNRLFWPLIHMRYRYVNEKPHPVQRISALYRLTW